MLSARTPPSITATRVVGPRHGLGGALGWVEAVAMGGRWVGALQQFPQCEGIHPQPLACLPLG
jgi:hypothetical protein